MFGTNWKTTIGGLLTAAMGAASLAGFKVGNAPVDPLTAIGMITGGVGLAFAKDGNVTGGTVAQPTPRAVVVERDKPVLGRD